MVAMRPVVSPALASPADVSVDTSQTPLLNNGLNQPRLLGIDSLGRIFPNVYFCGEQVPFNQSSVVSRWKQTLLSHGYRKDYFTELRKRAAGFFPIIDPILRKYGIPRDFRYLPLAESDLICSAVSPKGACGYWQLMPQTARELGLVVTPEYDERFDLRKATAAACRHLRYLYNQLGSWTLVAAAYNGGEGRIQARLKRQNQDNYYDLRLNRETSFYLFRVLAFKELLTNAKEYKLVLPSELIKALSKPLIGGIKPIMSLAKRETSFKAEEDDATAPILLADEESTWGPRAERSFLDLPSDFNQWLADPVDAADDPDADLTKKQSGSPIKKLMGLFIFRFRRPRFLQLKKGLSNRPRHFWEWV